MTSRALLLAAIGLLPACGGGGPEAQAPIAQEQPEDQILRVGRLWQSETRDTGFRTAPSPIATFVTHTASRIAIVKGAPEVRETLMVDSTFKLQDGRSFACQATAEIRTRAHYGDHAGEPAIQLERPALSLPRHCSPDGFPDPVLALPATTARFALRGDRLVAFAPPVERREYLPAD